MAAHATVSTAAPGIRTPRSLTSVGRKLSSTSRAPETRMRRRACREASWDPVRRASANIVYTTVPGKMPMSVATA